MAWSLVGACHLYKLGDLQKSQMLQECFILSCFSTALRQMFRFCQAFSPTTMNTGKGDLSHGEVFYCGQCELSIHRFPFNENNVFRRSFGTIGCHDYSSIASSHHLLFDHTLNIGLTCPAPSQQFDKNGSQPALGRILWRPKEEVGRNLMTFR